MCHVREHQSEVITDPLEAAAAMFRVPASASVCCSLIVALPETSIKSRRLVEHAFQVHCWEEDMKIGCCSKNI
jgi:hypothetical protein